MSAVLALTVRRPETFRHFLDAAGKRSRLLPFDVLAYAGAEEVFVVTNLDKTATEVELGQRNGDSGQEIAIIQLYLKD